MQLVPRPIEGGAEYQNVLHEPSQWNCKEPPGLIGNERGRREGELGEGVLESVK